MAKAKSNSPKKAKEYYIAIGREGSYWISSGVYTTAQKASNDLDSYATVDNLKILKLMNLPESPVVKNYPIIEVKV
jgi:hypothetical protein